MHSVEREADGSWKIADDHLDKAAAYEARRMRDRPVTVETLPPLPLEQLPEADTATWPDQELAADNLCRFRDRNLLGDREPSESTKLGKALPASRRHIAACVMPHFCPRVVASRPAPERSFFRWLRTKKRISRHFPLNRRNRLGRFAASRSSASTMGSRAALLSFQPRCQRLRASKKLELKKFAPLFLTARSTM